MNPGFVYILSNSLALGFVKAGRSNNVERRIAEHNAASNSVGEWELFWSFPVDNAVDAERQLLAALSPFKIRGKREQFGITAEDAVEIANRFFDPEVILQRQKAKEAQKKETDRQELRQKEKATEKIELKRTQLDEYHRRHKALGVNAWAACMLYANEKCGPRSKAREQSHFSGTLPNFEISRFIESGGFDKWIAHPYFEENLEQARQGKLKLDLHKATKKKRNLSKVQQLIEDEKSHSHVKYFIENDLFSSFDNSSETEKERSDLLVFVVDHYEKKTREETEQKIRFEEELNLKKTNERNLLREKRQQSEDDEKYRIRLKQEFGGREKPVAEIVVFLVLLYMVTSLLS